MDAAAGVAFVICHVVVHDRGNLELACAVGAVRPALPATRNARHPPPAGACRTTPAVAVEDELEADLLPWTEMGSTPLPLLAIDARCPRRHPAGEDGFRVALPLMGSVRPTRLELAWLGSRRRLDGFLGPDLDLESTPLWRREDAFAVRRHGRQSASPPVAMPVAAWERIMPAAMAAGLRKMVEHHNFGAPVVYGPVCTCNG
ncbi:hypothetical protein ACLOJK_033997 [Asimina triloba]